AGVVGSTVARWWQRGEDDRRRGSLGSAGHLESPPGRLSLTPGQNGDQSRQAQQPNCAAGQL
ncbi:MAG: hypothetical protein HC875_40050, partial [Anaerolineales bacterium]|nr:hypothetical protein [Anaerolineales bacterium]